MPEYMTLERLKELEFYIYTAEDPNKELERPTYPLMADGTFGEAEEPVQGRFYAAGSSYDRLKSGKTDYIIVYCCKSKIYISFDPDYSRNAINGTIEARPEWFDETKVGPYPGGAREVEYSKYGTKPDCIFLGDGGIAKLQFDERDAPKFNRLYMKYDSIYKKYDLLFFFENKPYSSYPYTKWSFRKSRLTEKELLAAYNPPPRFPAIFVKSKRIGGLWVKRNQQLVKPSGVYVKQGGTVKKL
ncbi:hypothetical protein [Murdochiella massiliensis]|uniref:hypothetical protein n=1 Tax=Murdochiella massiliensis TaxID=1673723 RepID=UPI00082C7B5A|nr:hypothetical protein [Murdochiella massiliensis]